MLPQVGENKIGCIVFVNIPRIDLVSVKGYALFPLSLKLVNNSFPTERF